MKRNLTLLRSYFLRSSLLLSMRTTMGGTWTYQQRSAGAGQPQTYDGQLVDLEALDSAQVVGQLEFGQDDDFVAAPCCRVGHDHQPVDVAEGQQAHFHLRVDSVLLSGKVLKDAVLHRVGDDVLVGDHDGFLMPWLAEFFAAPRGKQTYRQTRGAAGVAKERHLASALPLDPLQGLELRRRMAHLDQVVHRLELGLRGVVGQIHDEDLVFGYPDLLGSLQSRLQHRHAGEERLGPRGPELVRQLAR